jgi:hypothetical protein
MEATITVSRANICSEFENDIRTWSKQRGFLDNYVDNRLRLDVRAKNPKGETMTMSIFVSHSSKDKSFAEWLALSSVEKERRVQELALLDIDTRRRLDEASPPIVLDGKPPVANERELAMQTFGQHPQHVQKAALAEMVALRIRAKTDDPIEREQLLAEHVEAVRDLITSQEH